MAELNQPDSSSWKEIAPMLDEAMQQLDKTDQEAVIWRFFRGRSFREIGDALAVSEDAAQKRVSRAVERLRDVFAKRGVSVGAGGLAVILASQAAQAAPAGLAAGISATALAATAGGSGVTLSLFNSIIMTKIQATILGAVVAGAVATSFMVHQQAKLRQENASLRRQLGLSNTAGAGQTNQAASPRRPRAARASASTTAGPESEVKTFQQVVDYATSHGRELPPEQIEAYLTQNHRNVESLLAAYQVSHDPAYLREAATNSPNVPAMQFAVLANNIFPDDQRKWIDAFKASSQGNALPWYFSALDYFKSNQPDQAIQELKQASKLPFYSGYAAQTGEAVQEMYDAAGWPALAAQAIAPGTAYSSSGAYLNVLKTLANNALQTQQQYATQGDAASATSMASLGINLGDQLRHADGPMDELVGIAMEKKILAQLDPAQSYDFLGCSVLQALTDLDQQKTMIRDILQTRDQVRPTLNESDLNAYWEREKIYGEMYAMQWLKSKYAQP
jgi:hypothetical protein